MKRAWPFGSVILAAAIAAAAGSAPADPIQYTFTGLPGAAGDCKWFDDQLNADRSVDALDRQTDMLYNRVALPPGTNVAITSTATTNEGDRVVGYGLHSRTICSTSEAIYGPTPSPSPG